MKKIFAAILSLASGVLLTASFAPFYLPLLAPIALAILLGVWHNRSPRAAFILGFIFGLGFFGTGASWVYVSIYTFGTPSIILAAGLTLLFIVFLSLFPAVTGYLLNHFFSHHPAKKSLLAFPALWVLSEWLCGFSFTGFPWLFVGYSQTGSYLKGFAPIFGVYGLSFAVTLTAGLIVMMFISRRWLIYFISLIALWGLGELLSHVNWVQAYQKPIPVSLVQGNIPQHMKWNFNEAESTLRLYQQLTDQEKNNRLIVWPETAVPVIYPDSQSYLEQLDQKMKARNNTIIVGVPIAVNYKYYNAAMMLGKSRGYYFKRHLVPFGEYIPLPSITNKIFEFFKLPMSNLSAGNAAQPLFHSGNLFIASFICYEMAYPELVRKDLPKANLLLTISDDAWFGRSIASAQHLQIGQMRSLETGRPMLFVSNSGITAILSPNGCISRIIPAFKTGVLRGTISPMQGETPWVYLGPFPLLIAMILLLIAALNRRDDLND